METKENGRPVGLSLARWHKVLDRAKDELSRLDQKAREAFIKLNAESYLGPRQVRALQTRRDDAWQALTLARALRTWRSGLRTALARKATEAGISARLAEMDLCKRELSLLERILEGQKLDGVPPAFLQAGFASQAREPRIRKVNPMFIGDFRRVPVAMLSAEREAALERRRNALKKQLMVCQDRLAALNQTRLTFPVPPGLGGFLGI